MTVAATEPLLGPAERRAWLAQLYAAMHEAVATNSLRLISVSGAPPSHAAPVLDELIDVLRGGKKPLTVIRADLTQNTPVVAAMRARFGAEPGRPSRDVLDAIGLGLSGLVTPARLDDAVRLIGGLVGATQDAQGRSLPGLEPATILSERFRARALKTALNLLRYDASRAPHLWVIQGAPATGAGLAILGQMVIELRERPVACFVLAEPAIADTVSVNLPARAIAAPLPVLDSSAPMLAEATAPIRRSPKQPPPPPEPKVPPLVLEALAFATPLGWPPLLAALVADPEAVYEAIETLRVKRSITPAGPWLVADVDAIRIDPTAFGNAAPSTERRAAWHRATADWLAAMRPLEPEALLEARIEHLQHGDRPEAAAELLVAWARQAIAADVILARLSRAAALLTPPMPALLAQIGLLSFATALDAGDVAQATAGRDVAARALVAFPGNDAELRGMEALLARHDGQAADARAALAEALAASPPEDPERRAYHAQRVALVLAGEPDTEALENAVGRLEDARRAARVRAAPRLVGRLACDIGAVESMRGRLEPAIEALEEATELLDTSGTSAEAAVAWLELSRALRARGEESAAEEALTRAADRALSPTDGDQTLARPTLPEMTSVTAETERVGVPGSKAGTAAPWAPASRGPSEPTRSSVVTKPPTRITAERPAALSVAHPAQIRVASEQARRLADAGRGPEALAILDALPTGASRWAQTFRVIAEARTALARGEERMARELAGAAVDLARSTGDVGLLADALRERARAAGNALFGSTDKGGGMQAALQDLREARDLLERTGRERDLPEVLDALGSALLESGSAAEARRFLERAATLRRAQRPPELAAKAMREARTIRREYPTAPIALGDLGEVLNKLQGFTDPRRKPSA